MRIGTGYDLHRLVAGRALVIGGVRIAYEKGLLGHSDADVLVHAVIDSLLGAAGLGDIGQHFPDTDARYRGADSMGLLEATVAKLGEAGYRVVNVDSTIVAEAPKLAGYLAAMRSKLGAVLGVGAEGVSVKAKTNEGVGPEGRGEAISAQAAALIERV